MLRCFPEAFEKCGVLPTGNKFLQDGDPRQKSRSAKYAFVTIWCEMFPIPARSQDLNPIENIFHLIRTKLKEDAISRNITHETFKEFSHRVAKTITNFSASVIDKTIASMIKLIQMVVLHKGERIKYLLTGMFLVFF